MENGTDGKETGLAALHHWRDAGLVWGGLLVLILWLFRDIVLLTIDKWWTNEAFTHAFLIFPIAGWVAWQRLDDLKAITPRPSRLGLLAMFFAGLVWLAGWLADTAIIQQLGLVFMIQASFLAIFGRQAARALLFPLFYLVFAVPAGDEIVPALQQFTAAFVVGGIELSGIPVYWDGIYISIPKGDFEVAETCSGVRFLIATVALGSLFANLSFRSWKRRVAVMLLAVLIPIIANGFRAYGIVMIAHLSDMKYAVGADHIIFGWVFFSFVLILLIAIGRTFSDQHVGEYNRLTDLPRAVAVATPRSKLFGFGLAGAAVALTFPIYAGYISPDAGFLDPQKRVELKIEVPTYWRKGARQNFPWRPHFEGATADSLKTYGRGDRSVSIFAAYYRQQRPGEELIQFANSVAGQEPWGISRASAGTIEINGLTSKYIRSRVVAGRFSRTVWHWYWIDGTVTDNRYWAKILSAAAKFKGGGRGAAVLAVSVPDAGIGGVSDAELAEIAQELGPVEDLFEAMVGDLADGDE